MPNNKPCGDEEKQKLAQSKIHNLPMKMWSRYQIRILICGVKFIGNNTHLKSDIQTFLRKLRLAECFDNISKNALDKDISPQPLAKNEPKFYPIKDKNKELNQFIDFLIIRILKTLTNLSNIILIKNSGLSLINSKIISTLSIIY